MLKLTAVPGRDRPVDQLGFHIFNLSEIFLDCCEGKEFKYGYFFNPIPITMATSTDIADYGKQIYERICKWWEQQDEASVQKYVSTYYGQQTVVEVLERTAWHTAQHVRQVMAFMEGNGIQPNRPLTSEDLKGLPVPESVSEN